MIKAINLVESRLNLDAVIPFHARDRLGEIRTIWSGAVGIGDRIRRRRKMEAKLIVDQSDIGVAQIRIDLGREKVVEVGPRSVGRLGVGVIAVDDVIGGMLVRPRRPQAVLWITPKMLLVRMKLCGQTGEQ